MLRATTIVRRPAVKAERVVDTLSLDHEERHKRRVALTAGGGLAFLLDLDKASVLDDGDAVKLEDGRLVVIRAAPERLIEIRSDNPLRLMKLAWHIGNRHAEAELTADALYIAHDHVLLEMVRGLGATTREVERPFRPERGAYECDHDHGHAHDHGHDHGHEHDHGSHDHGSHAHGDEHDHAREHANTGHDHADEHHAHRRDHGHGHDHGHD